MTKTRFRIVITDEKDGETLLDITAGRLVAVAVATTVGMEDVARKIVGDPRSDDIAPRGQS